MEKVSDVEFTPEVLACLPKANEEWSISPDERAQRIDFTGIRCAEAVHHQLLQGFCDFSHTSVLQQGHNMGTMGGVRTQHACFGRIGFTCVMQDWPVCL